MRKIKFALTTLTALPAVILYIVVFGLYCLMVGVFYLVQKPLSMLFGTKKSTAKIALQNSHLTGLFNLRL